MPISRSLFGRVLGRLGLEFAGRGDPGHVGQVHERAVVGAELEAQLAHGFEEGQRLDVAHGAADLDDGHVHRIGFAETGAALDELLDFVGDMRNHLHRLAQVQAAAFLFEHALVDLAGGEVVAAPHARFDETLVVAQIEIGLGTVVGDEYFAMLKRRHRARIHVDDTGSSLIRVTLRPRDSRIAAREAEAIPLPREDTTPPVTKTNLVMSGANRRVRQGGKAGL